MESFFRKYMWAINFGMIGAGALLTALLVNGFVAIQLAPFTVPEMPRYAGSDRGEMEFEGLDRSEWARALIGRCLFGCPEEVDPDACPEECADGEVCEQGQCVEVDEEAEEMEVSDVPTLTDLDLTLKGAMVASNPRWSIAMISTGRDGAHMVGVGEFLPGDFNVEIIEIRRDRVFIDNDGKLEFIRMEGSTLGDPPGQARGVQPQEPQQHPRAAARQEREAQAREGGSDRGGVVSRGDNQYTVDRDMVRSQLEDPAALQRQARIMPNYRDGEPNGLRLVGVTPNSFYSQLGIRSGDVIHSVNGRAITNQRQAMQMLETMGRESQVTIEVERRGRRQEMNYTIR